MKIAWYRSTRFFFLAAGLFVCVLILLSPFASNSPDGLEKAAEDLRIAKQATPSHHSPFPEYTLPFLPGSRTGAVLAGLIGAASVFALMFLFAKLLARTEKKEP